MPAISKAVLITGCSSGIGAATALKLRKEGWRVYATARRAEVLSPLSAAGCETLALDVTDDASMQAAVKAVEARDGAVGVLINNAGYSQSGALETLPIGRVRGQFETNVFGLLRLCQLVLPGMRAQGWGRIVNLSSMGGKMTFPGFGAYHATKYAVEALSDVLRYEARKFGVDVIVIEPGLIRSGFADAAAATMAGLDAPGDPYAAFNAAIGKATREAYVKGPLAWLSGGPENVAAVIARALAAPHPRTRYRVTASARVLLTLRAVLSDRAWDGFLGSSFPQPHPEKT